MQGLINAHDFHKPLQEVKKSFEFVLERVIILNIITMKGFDNGGDKEGIGKNGNRHKTSDDFKMILVAIFIWIFLRK